LTLVGEARATAGKDPIGFINPIIYPAATADQASLFDVVTSGSNGEFTAAAGWNAVTGWGGPHADLVLAFLANQ
jgi:kumamolisin